MLGWILSSGIILGYETSYMIFLQPGITAIMIYQRNVIFKILVIGRKVGREVYKIYF